MTIFHRAVPVIALAGILVLATPAACHGPTEHKEGTHAGSEEAMKAQHERMANFQQATEMLSNGIIYGNGKLARDGAEKLERSLEGHEKDMPHKNRERAKEFHGLYVELGKQTKPLKAAVGSNDLPKAALAYGRILEVCATCHKKFRD